ncbi:MAG: four helix bundle protein [Flavisolibacter sp.]
MTRSFRSLEIYEQSKKLVIACYELTHELPVEEKTNFSKYIRTAALNVHLNIAQGAFLKSKKRKKFMKKAKNSLVIIEAAAEILVEVGFARQEQVDPVVKLSSSCYQLIDRL